MNFKKKLMITAMTVASVVAIGIGSASACTMIYVGSDYTTDGSTFMARSEDYSNSYNKVAYVSEHGKHPAGSVYEGCYGFTHTFSHDSYSYTATSDDNLGGVCPDCDSTHAHTPMEECGTNEKGVSVSAMVTLGWKGNSYFKSVDPMVGGGMCESDMTTVLLGEASSAKQGVELLLDIYDTVGAEERSGVLIGDQKEVWYVENYTGHQYIAVKLSSSMIALSPNMGAIGLVDLDDTENVIASDKIIEVAKQAGTYVGDEAENTIDFRASYSNTSINDRMVNGLNYLLGSDKFDKTNISSADFTITNVKDGKICPMSTAIEAGYKISAKEMVDFYKVNGIGNTGNLEWHIFQIQSNGAMETSTVEWLGMENGQYTVAIPYLPVLTTDMYEGYKVGGIGSASFVTEKPDSMYGCYPYSSRKGDGYMVLPEGWEKGYYWSVDALSNYALFADCSDEDEAMIHANLAVMQQKCYDKIAEMKAAVSNMDTASAKVYATEQSAALAKEAHELTLDLYKHIVNGEHNYGEWETTLEPTCTDAGSKQQVCSVCGDTVTETIPANGHAWNNEFTVDKAASCVVDGSKSIHCANCDAVKDETVIPAEGHAWNSDFTVDKAETCTESGSKSIHCANCDAVKDVTVIAPHEHAWDEGKVTKEPTTLENGEKVLTCTECGQTKTVTMPALIIPQTGDNSNIVLWLALLAVSGIGAGAVVCTKKKSEEN
ncbi:MAG: C69 family dipeptidase [Oscillospiraceae bacterium]|nr:C69 family dipeptidase [Oscillospiraceae bacterium]